MNLCGGKSQEIEVGKIIRTESSNQDSLGFIYKVIFFFFFF